MEHGRDRASGAIRALGAYFVGDVTVADALGKICAAAIQVLPAASEAAVSTTVDRRPGTFVFTHPDVEAVDEPQYRTGDGPCVDAFTTGMPVVIEITDQPGPYGEFRALAAARGFRSVASLPLRADVQTVGALNLYSRVPQAFSMSTALEVEEFTTAAGYLLLNLQAYWDARTLSENLEQAMRSRSQIEQAKGIIMATTGCSPDEAFDQLRAQSQHENVKLREIAAEIVERVQRSRPHP